VTKNKCINVLRNESNRARLRDLWASGNDAHSEIVHQVDLNLLDEKMTYAVTTLSQKEQEIFRLRFDEGRTINEIAEKLATPEGTVKSSIFYMLKKISKHIKEFTHA
jgi:RNA polymerase sigma-70 factor, ECF subfamily